MIHVVKLNLEKVYSQVPNTGTRVLKNTRPLNVPVLFASVCHQHVFKDVKITSSGNTITPEMFQYSPILGRSSIWDLKYTFSLLSLIIFELFCFFIVSLGTFDVSTVQPRLLSLLANFLILKQPLRSSS